MNSALTIGNKKTLRNGIEAPLLGYGTFESAPDDVGNGVRWAIEAGYRHIDTAKAYGNEAEVGSAIRASGVARETLFIATKVWMDDYPDVNGAFESAARKLKTDYIDLFMLHWPGTDETLRYKAYETLLKLESEGKIHASGVSNFMVEHLESLKGVFGAYPLYNQIQVHPWGRQPDLYAFCEKNEIAVAAWGPLMHGHLKEVTELARLAEAYGRSPAQITLRWHLQRGNIVLPKSLHNERIIENADLFGFELSQGDMDFIDSLERDWHWGPDAYSFNG